MISCERCGAGQSVDDAYCSRCGAPLRPAEAVVAREPDGEAAGPSLAISAGLWRRVAAQLIDSVVLYLIGALIGGFVGFFMALGGATSSQAALTGAMLGFVASAIYGIAFHAASFQATVGKAALRIKVTDEEGARISVARSTGRYAGTFFSSFTLGVGFVMAGFTRRRQRDMAVWLRGSSAGRDRAD